MCFLRALWGRFYYVEKRSAVTVVDSGLHDTFASWCHYDLLMWSKIFKSEPPDVTPPGPFCCAAHRAATRLAPLTRAAATDASGLRPPRSAWQPLPLLPLISPSASYHDSSPALSVDCAAQWGAGRDGAVSPVTGRAAAANSQYGAATAGRRTARSARRPLRTPWGRQLRVAGCWLSREGGWPVAPVSPAVSGDLRPVSGGVRRGRLPCPDGHKNR
ncbi:hypothetical protein BANRA_05616 [Klebsiella pneumoniae]|nr:hypothetical protein BANRA_05616 [Klebsiella pneumoniae]